MVALLAIVTHVCPGVKMDEGLTRSIRDKHGKQLTKIECGEDGYEDMFIFACPKFVSPALPDYSNLTDEGSGSGGQEMYKLQVQQFRNEMQEQRELRKLRSYMKLYTSITIDKLAAFNDVKEEEFMERMLCYKQKMRQLETKEGGDPLDGEMESAADIHYYITGDMVHVGEEEKIRRFENFFIKGIQGNEDIMKDLEKVSTTV